MTHLVPMLFAAALPAQGWEADDASVTLVGAATLFEGEDADTGHWPDGFPLTVRFAFDADTTLTYSMTADSELEWPRALTHRWRRVTQGGLVGLYATAEIVAEVRYDLFGFSDTIELWTRDFEWTGQSLFDALLLPGNGAGVATVRADGEDLAALDFDLELIDGIVITLGGDLFPTTTATLEGLAVTTNDVRREHADAEAELAPPAQNLGFFDIETWWEGVVGATMDLELVPYIELCVDDGADCYDVAEFVIPLQMATADVMTVSEHAVMQHALPAIVLGAGSIDCGTTEVGQPVTGSVEVSNLGRVPVEGRIELIGDGFELVQDVFYATEDGSGAIEVRFDPPAAGTWYGTLVVTTNDPLAATLEIAVGGTAIEADPLDVEEDLTDGDHGAAIVCTCDGGTASSGWLWLLAGLTVLRRRR